MGSKTFITIKPLCMNVRVQQHAQASVFFLAWTDPLCPAADLRHGGGQKDKDVTLGVYVFAQLSSPFIQQECSCTSVSVSLLQTPIRL